ncbi:MAG: RNA methyltransferase [Chloroflexi bacterium]|nr:RNA methyltransferase [Chloroflexota bacterium]
MKPLHGTNLKRFLRDYRRQNPVTVDLALMLHSVTYPVNVGSLFRIADATKVSLMLLAGATPSPPQAPISKVGRDKDRVVPWRHEPDPEAAVLALHEAGYTPIALELTEDAHPYFEVEYPPHVALIVGNEDHGVSKDVLQHCQTTVFVPMYGKGLSLNVHVSAAVVLYQILHQPEFLDSEA